MVWVILIVLVIFGVVVMVMRSYGISPLKPGQKHTISGIRGSVTIKFSEEGQSVEVTLDYVNKTESQNLTLAQSRQWNEAIYRIMDFESNRLDLISNSTSHPEVSREGANICVIPQWNSYTNGIKSLYTHAQAKEIASYLNIVGQ